MRDNEITPEEAYDLVHESAILARTSENLATQIADAVRIELGRRGHHHQFKRTIPEYISEFSTKAGIENAVAQRIIANAEGKILKRQGGLEKLDERWGIVTANDGKVRADDGDYMYRARGRLFLLQTGEHVKDWDVYGDTRQEADESIRESLEYFAKKYDETGGKLT